MPKEQGHFGERAARSTSKNAKDRSNSATLRASQSGAVREQTGMSGLTNRLLRCDSEKDSEKDSGYSEAGSDSVQTDVEDQRSSVSEPHRQSSSGVGASPHNLPSYKDMTPVFVLKNVMVKPSRPEPLLHSPLAWGGAWHKGPTQLLLIQQSAIPPPAPSAVAPLKTHPKKTSGRSSQHQRSSYLPILNSYPRIAPHPRKDGHESKGSARTATVKESGGEGQSQSKRVCTEEEKREAVSTTTHLATPQKEVRAPSYSQQDMRAPLYSQQQDMRAPSYSQQDMRAPSYSQQKDMRAPSYSQQQDMRAPLYSQQDVRAPSYSQQDMRAPLYSQQDMRASSYSQQDVRAPLYSQQDMRASSYSQQDMRAPSYSQQDVRAPLYSQQDMRAPSYSQQDMRAPSYSQQDMRAPSYSQQDMRAPSYSRQKDMRAPSYSQQQDMRSPSYSQQDMRAPSYSRQDVRALSYSQHKSRSAHAKGRRSQHSSSSDNISSPSVSSSQTPSPPCTFDSPASSSPSSSSPSSSVAHSPYHPSPDSTSMRQRRFLNTAEILNQSGLLAITLRTKELLKQSAATEREIAQLRQHTHYLCQAVGSGECVQSLEKLVQVMTESGSYPELDLTQVQALSNQKDMERSSELDKSNSLARVLTLHGIDDGTAPPSPLFAPSPETAVVLDALPLDPQ